MRVNAVLYGIVAFGALAVLAAPIAKDQSLEARLSLPKLSLPKISTPKVTAPKVTTPKTSTSTGSTTSSSSGSGLSGLFNKVKGLFGGSKKPPPAPATAPEATPPAVKATTPAAKATTPVEEETPAAKATTAKATTTATPTTTKPATSSAATSSSTSTTSSAAESESALSCNLYFQPDAIHLSTRELERRGGEEYFFRFEDPSVTTGVNLLTLAARSGTKDFDDQAYKWISTDAGKVLRGSIPKRLPTLYVMPSGTRAKVLAAAKDFEASRDSQTAQSFVTKDNEPGDVGIQGVTAIDGAIPLDTFRSSIIRTVTVQTNKNNKTFFTIKNGKVSRTASKPDQAALAGFCA